MVSFIKPKLDYYTSIWHNSTIREILSFLDIEDKCADFVDDVFMSVRGIENNFNFRYNDIELSVSVAEFYLYFNDPNNIDSNVIDQVFRRIRLNLSGSGLDYLRSIGFDVDYKLRDECMYDVRPYHLTRVDIAFDFVNVNQSFMPDLCTYLHELALDGKDRVKFISPEGRNFSLSFSLNLGKQRTVYLGSTSGDKLLRIYDKGKQFHDSGQTLSDLPFDLDSDGIVSWFRIELQLRNKEAEAKMFAFSSDPNFGYYFAVLRWIYDNYMFRRMDIHRNYEPQPCDWWKRLWDWELIPELIIQNTNSVVYVGFATKFIERVERSALFFLRCYDLFGLIGFLEKANSYLTWLQTEQEDKELDFRRRVLLKQFIDRRNEYCDDERFGMFIKRLPNGHFELGISEDKLNKIIEILESD